jgi:signal transduction histidine kinase
MHDSEQSTQAALAALRESEERYRSLVEQNPLAILVCQQGSICFANSAAEWLLTRGKPISSGAENTKAVSNKLSQRRVVEFVRRDPNTAASSWFWGVLDGQYSVAMCEESIELIDGTRVEIELMSMACMFDGRPAIQMLLRDVSDRRRSLEETQQRHLQWAQTMRLNALGQMTAELAHELNQPLYAIANYAHACLESPEFKNQTVGTEIVGWLAQISEQAQRAGRIVRRVVKFVRKEPAQLETFDLNDLIWETCGLLEIDARRNDVRLVVELAEPSPRVYGDEVQIEQVLVNLALNAIQAMANQLPLARELTLTTQREDAFVQIRVKDHGEGVSDAALARLFEPFFTTKSNGMGLGLAICRSIIESHGGELTAQRNPEQGMQFTFTLPIDHAAKSAKPIDS